MTVSSDATSGISAASGGQGPAGSGPAGPAFSGFVPRARRLLHAVAAHRPGAAFHVAREAVLVLTGPPRARDVVPDLSGGTGKTQLAAHLARTWLAETPGGLLVWLNVGSRDALLCGYAQAVAAGRAGGWR
jgi:hypothetical protein